MSITYSCVIEADPKYLNQVAIWITTLLELGGARRSDLLVHVVEGEYCREIVEYLSRRGVAFVPVQRFGDGPYCNKLRQLRSAALRASRYAVLCDSDLAFCAPIDGWIGVARAAAKPVDLPNPPLEVLEQVYRRAGFARFPATTQCSHAAGSTYANNCNGGLYVLRTDFLDELAPVWEKWALWVLEQRSLLGDQMPHADQISFGLATWELGEAVFPLPAIANYPTHLPLDRYDPATDPPAVLHYHDRVGPDGLLLALGVPSVDDRIRLVNETLSAERANPLR
ncbi:MAG: hypothetical protein JWO85_132 [Candidatus Eremiobacteraeota bacterium]|nr:hypothetical protein [Candidatus Eremiobacteraeota bacterium]